MKGIVLPTDYFLVRDKQGIPHWYDGDPLKMKDREKREVDITNEISQAVGFGSIANPVVVRIYCGRIDRSVEFNPVLITSVRQGKENKHFEDMNGEVVDVLEVNNPNRNYPLTGVVFDSYGNVVGTRRYSFKGVCEDGNEGHHLIAINGPAQFTEPDGEEATEAEVKE